MQFLLLAKSMKQYCMLGSGNYRLSARHIRSYSLCGSHLYLSIYRDIVYGRFS